MIEIGNKRVALLLVLAMLATMFISISPAVASPDAGLATVLNEPITMPGGLGTIATPDTTSIAPKTPIFSDVYSSYWAYNAISSLSSKGIVSGYPDGTFKPYAFITRAEFANMLVKTLGLNSSETTGTFTDVAADAWYYGTVNAAAAANLVSGMGNDLFAPNALITREQMAVMVTKALGTKAPSTYGTELNGFGDKSAVSSWAVTGMEEAVKASMVSGMTIDWLAPQTEVTRDQAAEVIYNLLPVPGQ